MLQLFKLKIHNLNIWRVILIIIFLLLININLARGIITSDERLSITQPNGQECLIWGSGDDYFSFYHDGNGNIVIMNPITKYYVYADRIGDDLVTTGKIYDIGNWKKYKDGDEYFINKVDNKSSGYVFKDWFIRDSDEEMVRYNKSKISNNAPQKGKIHNIVVFIRFSDQASLPVGQKEFWDLSNFKRSFDYLKTYYDECSYGNLIIESHFISSTTELTNGSLKPSTGDVYDASEKRSDYINLLNKKTTTADELKKKKLEIKMYEYKLLANALLSVSEQLKKQGYDLDVNKDGYIDHVTFIIKGGEAAGYFSLLYPHHRTLNIDELTTDNKNQQTDYLIESKEPEINGIKLGDYSVIVEEPYFLVEAKSNKIVCHEFFHSLGAPDLYYIKKGAHNATSYPVGMYDIMSTDEYNTSFPKMLTQMNAYMKFTYGLWIDDTNYQYITADNNKKLDANGKQTDEYAEFNLVKLAKYDKKSADKYFYKIKSSNNSSEEYYIEYRSISEYIDANGKTVPVNSDSDKKGDFEGLIVYRVRAGATDNVDGAPFLMYVFRKDHANVNNMPAGIKGLPSIPSDPFDVSNYGITWVSGFKNTDLSLKRKWFVFNSPIDAKNKYIDVTSDLTTNSFENKIIPSAGFRIFDVKINNDQSISFKVQFEQNVQINDKN